MHTYDTVISLIYILFLCSVAQRLFNLFLPRFKKMGTSQAAPDGEVETEAIDSYSGIFRKEVLLPLLGALVVAGAVVGISLFISACFGGLFHSGRDFKHNHP